MKARVSISIDKVLLEKVKNYASKQGLNVSKLVEEYFETITQREGKPSLLDVLKNIEFKTEYPENFDFKKNYHEERKEKYGF